MFTKAMIVVLGLFPLLALAEPQKLQVDKAHSRVEVDVSATVDSFTGQLDNYTADIMVDDAGNIQSASFAFRFEDVKTGKLDRDEQMHAWQETGLHPKALFTLSKIETLDTGEIMASGTLEFHGVKHDLSFPLSISRDSSLMAIDGAATLDTRDYGLPIIRKFLLLKVDPKVVVRFHLQGFPVKSE